MIIILRIVKKGDFRFPDCWRDFFDFIREVDDDYNYMVYLEFGYLTVSFYKGELERIVVCSKWVRFYLMDKPVVGVELCDDVFDFYIREQ